MMFNPFNHLFKSHSSLNDVDLEVNFFAENSHKNVTVIIIWKTHF